MDTNTHKSVAIDIQTYNILSQMAEEECRSIAMQIKWLLKNIGKEKALPLALPSPEVTPIKMKPKRAFSRIITTGASADILVAFYLSRASMCGKDFQDQPVDDPSKILYSLATRGDLVRIGNVSPFYYQITPQGIDRAERILRARRENNGS